MEEQEQISLGTYCESLLGDTNFNTLVNIVEQALALDMLSAQDADGREKIHLTYKGLGYFVDTVRQFVINKDQIVAKSQEKEIE